MTNDNQPDIDPKKVENLHRILSVFDTERLTPKDFVGAFKEVIDHVKTTQELTLTHLQAITKAVNDRTQGITDGNTTQISTLRDELASHIEQKTADLQQAHADAIERLDTAVSNIENGKDADETVIVRKVLAKIPPPAPEQLGEDFRNALEALQGNDRLDKSAIRGLDELEQQIIQTRNTAVIGNNPGVQLSAGSGYLGRFQSLIFPNATVVTSNTEATITFAGSGSGTVTSASIVSANGFAGSVANATTTPAITLTTTVTGLLKGNGTAISAATAGTDYQAPITLTTTGTSGAATLVGNTLNIPQYAGGGTGITRSVNSISTATNAGAAASTDYVYYVSGATTLTLPTAVGNTNMYRIIRTGTSTVTIATTSSQTINGAAAPLNLITQYTSVDLESNGANWFIH